MTTSTEKRSDEDLQTAVQAELAWTPDVDAPGIGVAVDSGAVTLTGEVDDYYLRAAVTQAALRVRGVVAVVDDLSVHAKGLLPLSESDIAREVERALAGVTNIPRTVKAQIKEHTVTLTGQVHWDYQRRAAERAVEYLHGVFYVFNHVTLTPRPTAADAELRIRHAFQRSALVNSKEIEIQVSGSRAILSGNVHTWAEKEEAGRAAWSSPDVTDIENLIVVRL